MLKIHNIRTLTVCAIACALTSCHDLYPVMLYGDMGEQGGFGGRDDMGSMLIPVKVYISDPSYINVSTRAASSGPLDRYGDSEKYTNKYRNMQLRTWAFRCTQDNSTAHSAPADMRATMTTDTHRDDCLVSSLDGTHNGALTRLVDKWPNGVADGQLLYFYDSEDAAVPTTLYYDKDNYETGYNFFACLTDGAEASEPVATDGSVSMDIEIDGTNEVMAGSAPAMSIQLLNSRYSDEEIWHITDEERQTIAGIGGYSAYASRHGVDPIIDLRHQLTRLRFRAFPGNFNCQGITITGIKIYSHRTGRLVAAAHNPTDVTITATGKRDTLYLHESSIDGLQPCAPFEEKTVEWYEDEAHLRATERTPLILGSDIMLIPGERYDMYMDYRQLIGDRENSPTQVMKYYRGSYQLYPPRTADNYDEAAGEYVFKPGKLYDIGIIIYGLERIEVTSSIETWKDGGEISGELDK